MNYQLSVGFNGKKDTLLKIINSSNKVGDVTMSIDSILIKMAQPVSYTHLDVYK